MSSERKAVTCGIIFSTILLIVVCILISTIH